jgi:hypothetical protein
MESIFGMFRETCSPLVAFLPVLEIVLPGHSGCLSITRMQHFVRAQSPTDRRLSAQSSDRSHTQPVRPHSRFLRR